MLANRGLAQIAVGIIANVFAVSAFAQTITGISTYSVNGPGAGVGTAAGGHLTNTQGADFPSSTFITQGTSPSTDAFLYNSNAAGALLGSGINLALGTNTFYLYGFQGNTNTSGQAFYGVSLMSGVNSAASLPSLSAYYVNGAAFFAGTGTTVFNDFYPGALVPNVAGGGLSALFGGFMVTITDFSPATVVRNSYINAYSVDPSNQNTISASRLVLNVAAVTTTVPEPASYMLLGSGLCIVGFIARRRRQR